MQQLNFPPVQLNLKIIEGKYHIFDVIRKKFIVLTPEEWVRQHVIHYLLDYHQYSKGLIKIESGLKYNQLQKRTDILIFDRKATPFFLIECKAYDVKLNNKVIEQAAVYNKSLSAPYLMVSNGLDHYCCKLIEGRYTLEDDIPKPPEN